MNAPPRRSSILTLAAALLLAVPAAAETYRCRTPDGSLVFTDDPARFPADCRPLESSGRGSLNVVPITVPTPSTPRAGEEPAQEGASEAPPSLLEEAEKLAAAYRQAQAERIGSLPPAAVQQALDRMQELEEQKAKLLARLRGASLPAADKRDIRQRLEFIPDP